MISNTDSIVSVPKQNLGDVVFEQMKSAIINGKWKPGEKIPSENELAKVMGVSRITVREAFQKFTSLGIMESRQGEGTFLRSSIGPQYLNLIISSVYSEKSSILELLELRSIIEVESAALAATRATEQNIADLKETLEKLHEFLQDTNRATEQDILFHFKIAECTGNSYLIHIMNILRGLMYSAFRDVVAVMGSMNACYYHSELNKAIENRDPNRAREVMQEHIDNTIQAMGEFISISSRKVQ